MNTKMSKTRKSEAPAETYAAARRGKGAATCAGCLFGRAVEVVGTCGCASATPPVKMCECHVARPTRFGFPVVRPDDFCALHVDAKTRNRTFAGLAPTVQTPL